MGLFKKFAREFQTKRAIERGEKSLVELKEGMEKATCVIGHLETKFYRTEEEEQELLEFKELYLELESCEQGLKRSLERAKKRLKKG